MVRNAHAARVSRRARKVEVHRESEVRAVERVLH